MTVQITLEHFSILQYEINRLNKKAQKKGWDMHLTLTAIPTVVYRPKTSTTDESYVDMMEVTVTGQIPVLKGYSVIGTINDQGLINEAPEKTIPDSFRENDLHCDHCQTNRGRKLVVILKNSETNEFLQVGRSCLKDYTGTDDIERLISMLEPIMKIYSDSYDEECDYDKNPKVDTLYSVLRILSVANKVVRTRGGYVSTSETQNYHENPPTSYIVKEFLSASTKVEKEDIEKAKEVLEWFNKSTHKNTNYIYNIKKIIETGYTTFKGVGYLASVVKYYNCELIKEIERKNKPVGQVSEYQGTIGKKFVTTAILLNEYSFDTQYGYCTCYKFIDSNGNIYVWFTTKDLDTEIGDIISIAGKVKEHKLFREKKETILTRCKVVAVK